VPCRETQPWRVLHELGAASSPRSPSARFAPSLALQIRNPAHVIGSAVTFLQEAIPHDHASRGDLDAIAQSTEALHRLVNDVIAFSAIRRGRLDMRPQLLEVRPLVRRILQNHRQFASVPLVGVVEPAVPAFMVCDPMRLQQVLVNGLTNAW